MGRTINGKSFKEVLTQLQADFAKLIKDEKGNLSYSYEQAKERADEILGLNYSFELLNMRLVEIDDKKAFCGEGLIIIYDDDGNEVCRRMHAGGANIIIHRETKVPVDISNDYTSAVSDIFKRVCKSLSMDKQLLKFRNEDRYVDAAALSKNNSNKNSNKNNSIKNNVRSIDDKKAAKEGEMIALENYSSSCENKLSYKIKVKKDGKEGYLVFWKNQLDEKFIDGIKKIKTGHKFDLSKLEIEEKEYNGEIQFHVKLKAA